MNCMISNTLGIGQGRKHESSEQEQDKMRSRWERGKKNKANKQELIKWRQIIAALKINTYLYEGIRQKRNSFMFQNRENDCTCLEGISIFILYYAIIYFLPSSSLRSSLAPWRAWFLITCISLFLVLIKKMRTVPWGAGERTIFYHCCPGPSCSRGILPAFPSTDDYPALLPLPLP